MPLFPLPVHIIGLVFKKLVQLFLNALLMVLFFVVLVMIFVLFEMLEILLAVVSCWNFMDRGIKNVGSSCGSCLLRTQL